jgi:hypothetical protein
MRQVPHYLIIGNGRVSRHFQHYFTLLNLSFSNWHRAEPIEKLHNFLDTATHILILISDKSIDAFITQHLSNSNAIRIHFSGSVISEYAYGAHPLTTFNHDVYSLEKYSAIPFIIDHDAPENLLPGLPNSQARLNKSLKEKYHALCVLSGNFSCLLWQKLFSSLENEFNLPHDIAHIYLQQQTENLLHDFKSALTGPLIRKDYQTIKNNINALEADPFQEIYKNFVSCYERIV